jgi:hypothetical protein
MSLTMVLGLRHGGPVAWLAGAAWIAAFGLALRLLFLVVRHPDRSSGTIARSALACAAVGAAATAAILAGQRQRMLSIALGLEGPLRSPPDQAPVGWYGAFELTGTILFVVGLALACCAMLFALSAILTAACAGVRSPGGPQRLVIVLAVAALAGTIGLTAARVGEDLASVLDKAGPGTQESLAGAVDVPIANARVHVVAVAAVGWIAAVLAVLRTSNRHLGRRSALAAGAVFVLGAGAFAATRGMAYDARHLIPRDRLVHGRCDFWDPARFPVVTRGEPLVDAQLLDLEMRKGELTASLDGLVTSQAELGERLRRQRDLWVQLTRRPASDIPPTMVVAPGLLPAADVANWLRPIEEHLARGFVVVGVDPGGSFSTRTLGELAATPRCSGVPVRLDPAGPLLTSYPTWGDVVRGYDDAHGPIRLRLR